MQKSDFFPEKEDEESFAYVLEFMPIFDRMQNTSPLMLTKFEIWGQSILKVIPDFHTKRGCSGPVVECLNKINMLQSTTQPLGRNYGTPLLYTTKRRHNSNKAVTRRQ